MVRSLKQGIGIARAVACIGKAQNACDFAPSPVEMVHQIVWGPKIRQFRRQVGPFA
jgi:hypothetical protein